MDDLEEGYIFLTREFEQKLNRELTDKEHSIIKWMVKQQNMSRDIKATGNEKD
ncbi:hypothetical protein SAMN05192534_1522 [Alteribacillus persepolensis]|uniref:Uncharacterized protein n=1 Tax=Alteribacillus persepolensis TaxID=568899 RepID=A0A1G8KJA4_9BACI|nr:hypothetical protein [Alteribacillus persepolensis]SDI43511.1 hypothetical protein SAMN05192534_1522 [Alteribacillus persepolensis]